MEKEQERRHDRGTVKVDSRWGSNVRPRYIDSHSRSLLVLPSFSLAFHLSHRFSLPVRHSRSRTKLHNATPRPNELANGSLSLVDILCPLLSARETLGTARVPRAESHAERTFSAFRFRACRARKRDRRTLFR